MHLLWSVGLCLNCLRKDEANAKTKHITKCWVGPTLTRSVPTWNPPTQTRFHSIPIPLLMGWDSFFRTKSKQNLIFPNIKPYFTHQFLIPPSLHITLPIHLHYIFFQNTIPTHFMFFTF